MQILRWIYIFGSPDLGHKIILQTFNDAKAASWCSLCGAHLALWCSTCNYAAHPDRGLCAACSSAKKTKRPLEVPQELQAKRKKKLKISDFCKNGCTSERGAWKFSWKLGFCFLCYKEHVPQAAGNAPELARLFFLRISGS